MPALATAEMTNERVPVPDHKHGHHKHDPAPAPYQRLLQPQRTSKRRPAASSFSMDGKNPACCVLVTLAACLLFGGLPVVALFLGACATPPKKMVHHHYARKHQAGHETPATASTFHDDRPLLASTPIPAQAAPIAPLPTPRPTPTQTPHRTEEQRFIDGSLN